MNLEEIVNDYLNKFAYLLDREICFFGILPSLTETISMAAMAETSQGKQSSHQPAYRFSTEELETSKRCLLKIEEQIRVCETFEGLQCLINTAIRPVYKNAILYVYDTAWKIGAKLNLEPKTVYLHAGILKGVKALGLDVKRDSIDLRELPVPLQRLRPIHTENLLCIYKDQLSDGFAEKHPLIRGC